MTGDAGFPRRGWPPEDHRPRQGRRPVVERRDVRPNYIENKLKFFQHIKEVVCFGHDRDMVTAFINIDMGAVGNWG